VPFVDEVAAGGVAVQPYRPQWAAEATSLAEILRAAVPAAFGVEHIGSTSIPGMAAKDCLDMMVVVANLQDSGVEADLCRLGYRRRPEPWNNLESAAGKDWPKMVFAPPAGGRPQNIHVRTAGSATLRVALLFRDHLRDSPQRTAWWSQLKSEAADATTDLASYGRIKYPAWCLLMELAEVWATTSGWQAPVYSR
jgi:dephospho-CoA kinase